MVRELYSTDLRELYAELKKQYAQSKALMDKYAIESDKTLTECIERNINGWEQRCLRAERERDALWKALEATYSAVEALRCECREIPLNPCDRCCALLIIDAARRGK